eukprot:scaffold34_cov260-Pinguiococcus_pyrenoidosus.AAC.18
MGFAPQPKFIPWKPIVRFTGISDYTLEGARIKYEAWGSTATETSDGTELYERAETRMALTDFIAQLFSEDKTPGVSSQELPYELLRRSGEYEVRRYPAMLVAETQYSTRPEGFDRLGSFCGGSNEGSKRVKPYAPSIIRSDEKGEKKVMQWPISFAMPGQDSKTFDSRPLRIQPAPTVGGVPNPGSVLPSVSIQAVPELVVAVRRFANAATQQVVVYESKVLRQAIQKNGLKVDEAEGTNLWFAQEVSRDLLPFLSVPSFSCVQYDAIFSLGDRRNEVWVPVAEGHPWDVADPLE